MNANSGRSEFVATALAAAAFAVAGLVATLPFVLAADDARATAAMIGWPAALSAGVWGAASWHLIVAGRYEGWRPAVAGAAAGLLAHPMMWILIATGVGRDIGAGAGEVVQGAVMSSVFFGFFSTLIYGPFTALVGAAVGWLLGRALRPRT